jgi:hypothetical protein
VEEIVGHLSERTVQQGSAGVFLEEVQDFGDQPGITRAGGFEVPPPFAGGALGSLVEQRLDPGPAVSV